MKVKINNFIIGTSWYENMIGSEWVVKNEDSHFYTVIETDKKIVKDHCDIIEATDFELAPYRLILKNKPLNKIIIKRIDELFELKLQQKTGWGKNDVLDTYRKCVTEALLEILD